jgi:hypothetical protein
VTVSLPPDTFQRFRSDPGPPDPKAKLQEEIDRQVAEYLAKGGEIEQIPPGKQTELEQNFNKSELIQHHKRRTRAVYDLKRNKKR